jgi:hypothetical protein
VTESLKAGWLGDGRVSMMDAMQQLLAQKWQEGG